MLTSRISNQIQALDRRLDGVELNIATSYVSKQDFQVIMAKMEGQLNRIEEKVDRLSENRTQR